MEPRIFNGTFAPYLQNKVGPANSNFASHIGSFCEAHILR